MIKYLTIIALTVALVACSGSSGYQKAEDAQDAGRQFIRASLDGNYEKAKFYLLKDDDNLTLLKKQQANYQQLSNEDKRSFADANINPLAITPVNDSVTTYQYHNSFHPQDTTTIRIVKINNEWLVDLKSVIKM
jgi:hypothetical protein